MLILIIGFKVFLVLVLILEFVRGYCCNLVVCRFKIMDLDDYLLFLYYIFVFLYYIFYIVYVFKFFIVYCIVFWGIII